MYVISPPKYRGVRYSPNTYLFAVPECIIKFESSTITEEMEVSLVKVAPYLRYVSFVDMVR